MSKNMRTISKVSVNSLWASARHNIHRPFDEGGIDSWLVYNIRQYGILCPLIISPSYEILDGTRRWRAAKAVGRRTVPCVVWDGPPDTAFESAQLHRNLSTYAKCVLYRDTIEDLITAGQENSKRALAGQAVLDLDDDWIKLESVLGVKQRTLIRGVKLLSKIDAWKAGKSDSKRERAVKWETVFREIGLYPALRLKGEKLDDLPIEDCEPGHVKKCLAKRKRPHWSRSLLNGIKRCSTLARKHAPEFVEELEQIETKIRRKMN